VDIQIPYNNEMNFQQNGDQPVWPDCAFWEFGNPSTNGGIPSL
jgi:hypothetical protein